MAYVHDRMRLPNRLLVFEFLPTSHQERFWRENFDIFNDAVWRSSRKITYGSIFFENPVFTNLNLTKKFPQSIKIMLKGKIFDNDLGYYCN